MGYIGFVTHLWKLGSMGRIQWIISPTWNAFCVLFFVRQLKTPKTQQLLPLKIGHLAFQVLINGYIVYIGGISLTDPDLILPTFDGTNPNHQFNQVADV